MTDKSPLAAAQALVAKAAAAARVERHGEAKAAAEALSLFQTDAATHVAALRAGFAAAQPHMGPATAQAVAGHITGLDWIERLIQIDIDDQGRIATANAPVA